MIETKRLLLIPLSSERLYLFINDMEGFEMDMQCKYKGETLTDELRRIFARQLEIVDENERFYKWCTLWVMIEKKTNRIIGSLGFKDIPDKSGKAEIGYGIGDAYRNRGYTTEAVAALIDWSFREKSTNQVIAEIDKDNIASRRVAEKCGMNLFNSIDNFNYYRIFKGDKVMEYNLLIRK